MRKQLLMPPHTQLIHAEPNLNNVREAVRKSEITVDLSMNMSEMFALYMQQNSKMTLTVSKQLEMRERQKDELQFNSHCSFITEDKPGLLDNNPLCKRADWLRNRTLKSNSIIVTAVFWALRSRLHKQNHWRSCCAIQDWDCLQLQCFITLARVKMLHTKYLCWR